MVATYQNLSDLFRKNGVPNEQAIYLFIYLFAHLTK